jgi:hypothetical protein
VSSALSGPEHRTWRQVERRALRDHNAQQLATLRNLAATEGALTSLIYPDGGAHVTSAEFMIAGKRIRAGRIYRPTLMSLTQALGRTPMIRLLTASRYGPFWVLTFDLAPAPLAVLADKLFIPSDRHGSPASPAAPPEPADADCRPGSPGPEQSPPPSPIPGVAPMPYTVLVAFSHSPWLI